MATFWVLDGKIVRDGSEIIYCDDCPCSEDGCCYPNVPAVLTLTITAKTGGIVCLNVGNTATLTWSAINSRWEGSLVTTGAGGCPASYAIELYCPPSDGTNPDDFELIAEFYSANEAPNPGGTCSPLYLEISGTAAENGGADSISCEITE